MPNLRLWHPHDWSLGSVSCRKSEVPERVESKYNSPFCTISKDIEEYKRMVQVRQVEWINEKEALSDRSELSQDKWNSPFCRISETCCQENQVFCPKNGLESIWSSIDEKESVILTPLHSARNFPVPKKKRSAQEPPNLLDGECSWCQDLGHFKPVVNWLCSKAELFEVLFSNHFIYSVHAQHKTIIVIGLIIVDCLPPLSVFIKLQYALWPHH